MIYKRLGKGAFARLLAYALFVLGFWLLFQAFERSSPVWGVLGGISVLLAMYWMVGGKSGRGLPHPGAFPETTGETGGETAEAPGDEPAKAPGDDPGNAGGGPPESRPPGPPRQ